MMVANTIARCQAMGLSYCTIRNMCRFLLLACGGGTWVHGLASLYEWGIGMGAGGKKHAGALVGDMWQFSVNFFCIVLQGPVARDGH